MTSYSPSVSPSKKLKNSKSDLRSSKQNSVPSGSFLSYVLASNQEELENWILDPSKSVLFLLFKLVSIILLFLFSPYFISLQVGSNNNNSLSLSLVIISSMDLNKIMKLFYQDTQITTTITQITICLI